MKNQVIDIDIYDFYEPSLFDNVWVQFGIGLFVVLILGSIIYLIIRHRKKPPTAGQIALRDLSVITSKDFSNKKEVKAAYFAITTVIKRYLSTQFKLKALDKTDDELIAFLEDINFHGPTCEAFKKIHHNALWVKFANYDLIKTQVEQDMNLATTIITTLEAVVQQQAKR